MSRVSKTPITVPADVDIIVGGFLVTVKGKGGKLSHIIPVPIAVALEEGQIFVSRPDDERALRSFHSLIRTLIANMVVSVTGGHKKSLKITGTGYRMAAKGENLKFAFDFSHPITIGPVEGIELTAESQTKFTIHDTDKQPVDETAVRIRKLKKPEPYKDRGIYYVGEVIRHKAGKAGK